MKSLEFYANIPAIQDFNEVMNLSHYQHCPSDWLMVLTDIKGSTKAIEEGRQKDVNLIGAAAIAAVQNVVGSRSIPFTFGGDGATFILPQEFESQLKIELLRLKKHSDSNFNLELRICIIPIDILTQKGTEVLIGKYALAAKNSIALFLGSGFQLAEQILKTVNSEFELTYSKNTTINEAPNLKHLSCRWDKIPSKYGVIASVLIMSRTPDHAVETYNLILSEIEKYVRLIQYNPVANRKLSPIRFIEQLTYELKNKKNLPYLYRILFLILNYTFMTYSIMTRKNLFNNVKVVEYLDETFINSDYKKIDGILKMVIDCTAEEKDNLLSILNQYYNNKKIFFGVHLSDSSLMTCVVHDMKDNQHVHFIDGNNGGYAFAAKELKAQIKSNLNESF